MRETGQVDDNVNQESTAEPVLDAASDADVDAVDSEAAGRAAAAEAVVAEAEARASQLEGLIAELLLATVVDEAVSGDVTDAHAITASLVGRSPRPELEGVPEVAARLAAVEADGKLLERVEALVKRLAQLEQTVVELMDGEVEDLELPEGSADGS